MGLVESDPMRILGCRAAFERLPRVQVASVDVPGLIDDSTIDMAILGLRPPFEALALLPLLRSARPDLRLILLGDGPGDEAIVMAIEDGARGHIDGAASPLALRQAVRTVSQGLICASDRVLALLANRLAGAPMAEKSIMVTPRERQVLDLLTSARSNREIAAELGIEERTVKSHMARLLRKFSVNNRIELSLQAMQR